MIVQIMLMTLGKFEMEKQIKNRFEKIEVRVEKLENFVESGLSKKGKLVECHRCNHSWLCLSP